MGAMKLGGVAALVSAALAGLSAPVLLPAGTMLHVVSWHDNTAANKFNPDPTNWAGFGQRSIDDMSFAWMTGYELTDDQYKEMVAEREGKAKATTQQQQ